MNGLLCGDNLDVTTEDPYIRARGFESVEQTSLFD
jgi:hypothetical protein